MLCAGPGGLTVSCLRQVLLFAASQLQEDILKAEADGMEFVQVPAGMDHGAGQVGANLAALQAFDFEGEAAGLGFAGQNAADSRDLFQLLLDSAWIERSVGRGNLQGYGLRAAQAVSEILDGV